MENGFYRYSLIAAGLLLALLLDWAVIGQAIAQSGCTGDPCVFHTPTATPTHTPGPTPGPGTPTAVAMPNPSPFPRPNYGIPTSIPVMSFPSVPSQVTVSIPAPTVDPWMTPAALPMPGVISITLPSPGEVVTPSLGIATPNILPPSPFSMATVTAIPLSTVSAEIPLTYTLPMTLAGGGSVSSTLTMTGMDVIIGDGYDLISGTISYTNWLSAEATKLQATDDFTIATAPSWYAPKLPRPIANVGWTFEGLRGGIETNRYSPATWGGIFGYAISLPIQFIKMLFQLAEVLGPFGLFLIWVLVMLPFVLFARFFIFIKNSFIWLFNFLHRLIRFIGDIWDLIPGL